MPDEDYAPHSVLAVIDAADFDPPDEDLAEGEIDPATHHEGEVDEDDPVHTDPRYTTD